MKTIDDIKKEVEYRIREKSQPWQLDGIPPDFPIMRSRQASSVLEVLFEYIQQLEGRVLDLENKNAKFK